MRDDISAIFDRDLPGWQPGPRTAALEQLLGFDEDIAAVAIGTDPVRGNSVLIALTDRRVLLIPQKGDPDAVQLHDLRSAAGTAFPMSDEGVFALLEDEKPFAGFRMPASNASQLADRVRDAIRKIRTPVDDIPFWQDARFSSVALLRRVGLLLGPSDCAIPNKTWITASFVTTGVQFRTVAHVGAPDQQMFVPWGRVSGMSVEGLDQVQQRPSVGAVLAFGVLGLAARRSEKRAYLALSTADGEYVLEVPDMLPSELRGVLAPFLAGLNAGLTGHGSRPEDESGDPIEKIRRLGELRDAGLVTNDEFETKKAELLKRL